MRRTTKHMYNMRARARSETVLLKPEGTRHHYDEPKDDHDEDEDQELEIVLLSGQWLWSATTR